MLSLTDTRVKYHDPRKLSPSEGMVEDNDVFEITDFTTASDWERIIVRLEDVIADWKLPRWIPESRFSKDTFTTGKWSETCTDITDVPDFEFVIKRIRLRSTLTSQDSTESAPSGTSLKTPTVPSKSPPVYKSSFSIDEYPAVFEQMLSTENDFPLSTTVHPLARWFGLADFLLLAPSAFNNADFAVSEDRLKLMNSCISIAVSNTKCPIPIFLQFDQPSRQMFFGVSEVSGFRTSYDIIELEKVPERLQTLSGLVELFNAKIGCVDSSHLIKTSIQQTVKLRPDSIYGLTEDSIVSQSLKELGSLPFGSMEYETFLIDLYAVWPNANADAVEDTLLQSDLDPLQAPKWSAQLVLNDKATQSLTESLRKFAKQTHRSESVQSLLEYLDPIEVGSEGREQASDALRRLTGPEGGQLRSRLSKAIYSHLPRYHLPAPIEPEALNDILAYLFPDSDLAKDVAKGYPVWVEPENMCFGGELLPLQQSSRPLKAAPCDSLPFKLALSVYYVHEKFGGLLAVAYLWQELLLELRYRWENGFVIPGVEPGPPNQGSCLLHQKLQMLNCCVDKRHAERGSLAKKPMVDAVSSDDQQASHSGTPESLLSEDEDDDEFYDCIDGPANTSSSEEESSKRMKPEGRLAAHPDLFLLSDGVTPVYIPFTQEVAPMTEDAMHDHLEKLVATDDDEGGQAVRVKLQSVALVSDMSAFKAANPGCGFTDFVRWHSPRDWEYDDQTGVGHLSERMAQSGSAWLEAWNSADAKSVKRQKRLFDERVEAEKVLSFLNTSVGDVFRQLLPLFIKASIVKLFGEMDQTDLSYPYEISVVYKLAAGLLSDSVFSWTDFERLLKMVRVNEQLTFTYRSLLEISRRSKSSNHQGNQDFYSFLKTLVEKRQITPIPGGGRSPVGQQLAAAFNELSASDRNSPSDDPMNGSTRLDAGRSSVKRKLPVASIKEFLLRTVAPRPYMFSRPSIHRLYASFRKGDCRIAGAFSEDVIYG